MRRRLAWERSPLDCTRAMPVEEPDVIAAVTMFLRDESGATAVEYAVMLGLILLAMLGGIAAVGVENGGMWGQIDADLTANGFGQ